MIVASAWGPLSSFLSHSRPLLGAILAMCPTFDILPHGPSQLSSLESVGLMEPVWELHCPKSSLECCQDDTQGRGSEQGFRYLLRESAPKSHRRRCLAGSGPALCDSSGKKGPCNPRGVTGPAPGLPSDDTAPRFLPSHDHFALTTGHKYLAPFPNPLTTSEISKAK